MNKWELQSIVYLREAAWLLVGVDSDNTDIASDDQKNDWKLIIDAISQLWPGKPFHPRIRRAGCPIVIREVYVNKVKRWAKSKRITLWGPPSAMTSTDHGDALDTTPVAATGHGDGQDATPRRQDKQATNARYEAWASRREELLAEDSGRTGRDVADQIAKEYQAATGKVVTQGTVERQIRQVKTPS